MEPSRHTYREERAAFYDVHVGASDREDVPFYVERARDVDGPVLEVACGTGRVYLELVRAGVDADGFDRSADALSILREKATDDDLDTAVWQADMADFYVDREYALVICPFNAMQHLLSVDEQLSALGCVHEALAPGGSFVFDVLVPDFDVVCETYGEWRSAQVEYRGATHEVRARSRLVDEVEQQFAVEEELYGPDDATVYAEAHRLKMLPKCEVELLARLSPFDEWRATGNFEDAPLADGDSVQVWTLEKAG